MKENIIIDNYKNLSDALLMLNNIDSEDLILFVKSDNDQIIGWRLNKESSSGVIGPISLGTSLSSI